MDDTRRNPFRLHRDRGRQDAAESLPKQLDVVDAVEQRHRDLRRGVHALERLGQLGRLGRDPQDVDRRVERRDGGELGVEVAEQRALDVDDAVVARERLVAKHEHDVASRTREGGAEESADSTRAEHCVSRHGATLAPVRKWCS